MKICLLLMLISIIVGFSYLPNRGRTKAAAPVAPDSVAANV
jgi:hypothetical protein